MDLGYIVNHLIRRLPGSDDDDDAGFTKPPRAVLNNL